jgi:hypothetical protein
VKRTIRRSPRRRAFLPAQAARAVVLVAGLALNAGTAAAADEEPKAEGAAAAAPAEVANEETAKLERATKEIAQLNYPEAQKLLFEVVQSGRATPEQLSKAYFGIGEVEAALGNEVEATDSFYLALMIQPATLFPSGGSPKIRQRLNEARSRVTEVGVLEASAYLERGVLDVQLRNDPLQLVKNIEVQTTRADGDVGRAMLDRKARRVQIDSDVQTIRVVLHDEAGNELKSIDVDPSSKANAAGPGPAGGQSVWKSWGLWAGVAGAFAAGGTYFILELGKLQDDVKAAKNAPEPNAPAIENLEDRRDRVGTYGVVGFSLAGAAAVTAGALLLFQDDAPAAPSDAALSDAAASNEARLVPNIGPGKIGADFSMRF